MTMLLPNSVFIHIPRTGGIWFRTLARRAGLSLLESNSDLYNHCRHVDLPRYLRDLPSLCFVRHPLIWVRSRWQFSIKINALAEGRLHGIHREFDKWVCPTLTETVQTILRYRPGLVGETYREVTAGVTYLRRTRDLPSAAIDAICLMEGETVRSRLRDILEQCPPCNCSEPWRGDPTAGMSSELESEFLASESQALKMWEKAE